LSGTDIQEIPDTVFVRLQRGFVRFGRGFEKSDGCLSLAESGCEIRVCRPDLVGDLIPDTPTPASAARASAIA
jgi:hypothetical protein